MLDRYRLERRLGSGGFGSVWLALDERLRRYVAVKIIPTGDGLNARIDREAVAAARLNHPAIVALYEAGSDSDAAYLVSELVEGATLAELIAEGALSDRDAALIGITLCDALMHAHEHGVIHRDVKPQNVIVHERQEDERYVAKLTDFGVARLVGEDALTHTGDVVGTLAYMAPEQADGEEISEDADLYSLGVVLYEAFSGSNPVRAGTPAGTVRRIGTTLRPLGRVRRDLPLELTSALDRTVLPDPGHRGTVYDLHAALTEALALLGDEPTLTPRRPLLGSSGAGPIGSRVLASVITGVGALVFLSQFEAGFQPLFGALACALLVAIMPRGGWLLGGFGLAVAVGVEGQLGVAVVLACGVLLTAVALWSWPELMPVVLLAPLLGLFGLALALPALLVGLRQLRYRATVAAVAGCWLVLLAPLSPERLYLGPLVGSRPLAAWQDSFSDGVQYGLLPIFSSGAIAIAIILGAAAVLAPMVVAARSLAVQFVAVVVWSAVLGSTANVLAQTVTQPPGQTPHGVVLGAVIAGALLLLPNLVHLRLPARLPPVEGASSNVRV